MSADEAQLARRLRRPVPHRPVKRTRRGTAFHSWLEHRWSASTLLDIDEIPGAVDDLIDDVELERLKAVFAVSSWADKTPIAVEVPFEMTFGGVVIRGRMDAVFEESNGRFTVVDWKTGKRPIGAQATAQATQLAIYRLAWADLKGIPENKIDLVKAAFYYVGSDETVTPADLLTAKDLRKLLS
jgi:DNA helicase-2/ATP-dependent DNA helicase PcrA